MGLFFRFVAIGMLFVLVGCMVTTFSYNAGKKVGKQETNHESTVRP